MTIINDQELAFKELLPIVKTYTVKEKDDLMQIICPLGNEYWISKDKLMAFRFQNKYLFTITNNTENCDFNKIIRHNKNNIKHATCEDIYQLYEDTLYYSKNRKILTPPFSKVHRWCTEKISDVYRDIID